MKKSVVYSSPENTVVRFNAWFDALEKRIFYRRLRDPEISSVADVVRENLGRLERINFAWSREEILDALAAVDRQLRILEAFVIRNELKKGYCPLRSRERAVDDAGALVATFRKLTAPKRSVSPVFERPVRRR